MKKATIKPNQSSLDMVLMACGTMEGAMQVMASNAKSITAVTAVGDEFIIPDSSTIDNTTLSYLQQNAVVIGTKGN